MKQPPEKPSHPLSAALACAVLLSLGAVQGAAAADLPPPDAEKPSLAAEYVLGPLDQISISVFQVPDLSVKGVQIDTSGQVSLPLIGSVPAAGRTANQLAADIAARLGKSYLQDPQVTVMVDEANSQKVTVEGAVNQPGVFAMSGPTTLLQTIAMAKGPDKTADISHVAIFRTVGGQRAAAVFDLKAIRRGDSPDPKVYSDDVVVVQGSATKGVWLQMLQTAPLLNVFRLFF